jgi:hypothetical protein
MITLEVDHRKWEDMETENSVATQDLSAVVGITDNQKHVDNPRL